MFAGRGNYHAMTTKITLKNGGRLNRKKSAFISRAIPLGAATVPRSCGGPVRMVKSFLRPEIRYPKGIAVVLVLSESCGYTSESAAFPTERFSIGISARVSGKPSTGAANAFSG
jgi:hypothetical protein